MTYTALLSLFIICGLLLGCFIYFRKTKKKIEHRGRLYDLEYFPTSAVKTLSMRSRKRNKNKSFSIARKCSARNNSIGLSMGGAKDVSNFRECIKQNTMPKYGSITYNGLLYEYQFNTTTVSHLNENNDDEKCEKDDGSMLFYPSYCYAKIQKLNFEKNNDDTKYEDEYYMTVGLNSNIREDDFKRKHLNLIIVLDKSGSMSNKFNFRDNDTKMMIANQSVVILLKHLTKKDRFGLVVFDNKATTLQTLQCVKDINLNKLKEKILKIKCGGGTNFECGYNEAIRLYHQKNKINLDEYENRIIFLTDAQPNIGKSDPESLLNLISINALNEKTRIYSTIIGVGLDFNGKLVDKITTTRGCNYYTVNSQKEFMDKMDKEFKYMVTPLVFNVVLKLKCEGNSCKIDKVYGCNDEDCSNNILTKGEITRIHTLFPSKKCAETGEVQGGILLIKLNKNNKYNKSNINVTIQVQFEDRNNTIFTNEQTVTFTNHKIKPKMEDMIDYDDEENEIEDLSGNYYDNNGIRKGILLCKYADLLMEWMKYEEKRGTTNKLRVSKKYKNIFSKFLNHFKKEMKICKDNKLKKEMDILNELIKQND